MSPTVRPGVVIRAARTAIGWNQAELGKRCGYSASQISRWETGRLPLRDLTVLRTFAAVLQLPPETFGLTPHAVIGMASHALDSPSHKVSGTTTTREEDEAVHRRSFLRAASLAGPALALPAMAVADSDPARLLATRLGDVLLGPAADGQPQTIPTLRAALACARWEFTACEYVPLARHLSTLLTSAEATVAERPHQAAHQLLADAYCLATRALIKLAASGLEWISADRAQHAARLADDPLIRAEAERLVASVVRRAGHHDRAQALTLAAADHLDVSSDRPPAEHLAVYGVLHLSAGYAAARAGDRERASDLLKEAETATTRLADDPARQRALQANLVSHRVSAAYVLGDAGSALAHARSLPLAAIPTTERRARLLVDAAAAYSQWGKPDYAYRTLLAAERTAPGEVRTRNAVRRLVGDLAASHNQASMPGLHALADRVHARV